MGGVDPVMLPTVQSLGKGTNGEVDESTALRSFDAWFLGEMLRISAPKDESGLMSGGQAGRMYQDHFYQELARIVASESEFGMSSTLAGQLEKTPEAQPDDPEKETR